MKRFICLLLILFILDKVSCQERIFSIGYAKTFITGDSTVLSLTVDLNRIPGQVEKAGSNYFVNELFNPTSRWGYYLKPMMDINIGSSISSSPNNIIIGLPTGIVYDFLNCPSSLYFDVAPELVADKSFNNNLYYLSLNSYVKYEILTNKILMDIIVGISNANGFRNQVSEKLMDNYGRVTIPIYLKLVCWKAVSKKDKEFNRISFTNTFKFNHIYSDNSKINERSRYAFFNSKFDLYINPNLALNITYFNGNEEPIFKQNHSLGFGLTLAR